ncbi:hypothetical protein LXA43DRAFT_901672, partial [Ganoderma leucocontextum]
LPPPRRDIQEVLAILFVGNARPSDADMRGTPFLLRHRDVTISHENLLEYPEDVPPVAVVHRKSGGNLKDGVAEVTASFESRLCVYCAQSFGRGPSYNSKIAYAIRYFDGGGAALAYGHDRSPQSIYHNPDLYPGMFPWLYPYALGGFENAHITVRLDHSKHVREFTLCRSPVPD